MNRAAVQHQPVEIDDLASPPAATENVLATSDEAIQLRSRASRRARRLERAPILMAALLSLVWLAAVAATIHLLLRFQPPGQLGLDDYAAYAAGATAPLTVIWLIAFAVTLRKAAGAPRMALDEVIAAEMRLRLAADRLKDELAVVEATLASAEDRTGSLNQRLDGQVSALVQAAGTLHSSADAADQRIDAVRAHVDAAATSLADASQRIEVAASQAADRVAELPATLDPVTGRLDGLAQRLEDAGALGREQTELVSKALNQLVIRQRDLNAGLAAVDQAAQDSERRLAEAGTALADQARAIEQRAHTLAESVSERAEAAVGSLNALLDRVADGASATHQTIMTQNEAMASALDALRTRFLTTSEELLSAFRDQAGAVGLDIDAIAARFQEQRQAALRDTDAVRDTWLRTQQQIAAGLIEQTRTLGDIQQRLGTVLDNAGALPDQLARGATATQQLATMLDGVNHDSERLAQSADTARERALAARDAMSAAAAQAAASAATANTLGGAVARLSDAATATHGTLERQQADIEAARANLETMVTALTTALADARAATEQTALQGSAHLLETLSRIRMLATQTSDALRGSADEIVTAAEAALAKLDIDTLHGQLVTPLKLSVAEVEAVSQRGVNATKAAVGRLGDEVKRIDALATTIEKRVAQTDEYLDTLAQQDLSRAASLLIESLNSGAIDIAKMIGTEVPDTDWDAYLKGDRGIFVRRAVKLVDRGARAQINKLFESEPEFRDQVRRYVRDFERLIARAMAERDGQPLSVALLSSDIGKLYVILAQSISRIA